MQHSSWRGLAFGIAVALSAPDAALTESAPPTATQTATDEFAARGQRDARNIRYGNWEKLCFKPSGAKMVCRTTISGTFETGQTALRIYLIEREGNNVARLQLFLPVGLYMRPGAKLTVDKRTAYRIPFTWCLTNTCIAADLAAPTLLREMEAGKHLTVEVVDTNLQAVTTSLPLAQFAAIRKGAPTHVFEQKIDE
jgi:invasion protein IalB